MFTKLLITSIPALAVFTMASLPVLAAPIAITNADFETPVIAAALANTDVVAGWTEENAGACYVAKNPGFWSPQDATQSGYFISAAGTIAVNQNLAHNWTVGDQFTLTVEAWEVGWQVGTATDNRIGFQLREVGGTVLWDSGAIDLDGTLTGVGSATPGASTIAWGSVDRHLTFNFNAADFTNGTAGSQINLRVYRANNPVQFDNISLEVVTTLVDSDSDGLDDYWEDRYFGNNDGTPDPVTELPLQAGGDDGYPIPDGDGLDNLAEQSAKTDPNNADSDDDLLDDGREVNGENGAGNSTGYGATDPNDADSDDDGVSDYDEVEGALNTAHASAPTNPNNPDTDADGMDDLYELENNLLGGLDPNTADGSPADDLDGDSLDNIDEYAGTFSGGIQTRADKADTDGDGFGDEVEDNLGSWRGVTATGTNPLNPDSDGDGLLDSAEIFDSGNPSSSDPNLADTDGDGFDDKTEMDAGAQANNELSRPTVGSILIANADFETPDLGTPPTSNGSAVTAWTEEDVGQVYINNSAGQWLPGDATQTGYFTNSGSPAVNQDLGYRWTSNDRYTLGIELFEPGFRVGIPGDSVGVQLRQADGTVLWSSGTINLDETLTGTENAVSWGAVSRFHTFTIDASSFTTGTPGEPLNLRIARVGGVNLFDNVSLNVETVTTVVKPRIVSCQFNGVDFEVVAENLDPTKSYDLLRGTDLITFPTLIDTIVNPTNPQKFTDTNARNEESKAFYRIRETP